MCGIGVMHYTTRDKYEGEWSNGMWNGKSLNTALLFVCFQ